jgi:hypothetical protein
MRRFLTHVLPSGFIKVRYDGLLSPTAKRPLAEVKTKVELAHGFAVSTPDAELPPWPQPVCPVCGGRLRYVKSLRAHAAPPPPVSVSACGCRSPTTA